MPEREYQALLYDVGQRFAAHGVPFQAQVELTKRCPLDCVHCYVDHTAGDELNTEEWGALFAELSKLGVFELTFTGGEIFLRPDLFALLERAHTLGFFLRLFTSGYALDESAAQRLHELGVGEVHLSLYAADAATHDAITRRPGSHAQTLAAVHALKREGLRVYLKAVLMRPNRHAFAPLVELAESLDCPYLVDTNLLPAEAHARDPLGLRLNEAELYAFLSDERNQAFLYHGDRYRALADVIAPEAHTGRLCEIGRTAAFFAANGDVMPCAVYPAVGNVRERPFREIWHGPELDALRALTHEAQTHCPSCPYRESCAPCPGFAFLEYGDPRACNSGSYLHARVISRLRRTT